MNGNSPQDLIEQLDSEQLDSWVQQDSDVAAVTVRQPLQPVGGKDTEIFPATYPAPTWWKQNADGRWQGYNIDTLPDGRSICLIDSVPAQAHRMSTLFKQPRYCDLVPQILITVLDKDGKEVATVNLLDAGHRAADLIVRRSELGGRVEEAFRSLARGDAVAMAKLSPLSLLFGVWDSRNTGVKTPRVLRSIVRGYQVNTLTRSTVYRPPVDYEKLGLLDFEDTLPEKSLSGEGFTHAPDVLTHGGVICEEIWRLSSLSLVALRALSATSPDDSIKLRRYILGLALVCLTAPHQPRLREGCELVPIPGRSAETHLVRYDGTRKLVQLPDHEMIMKYARWAAHQFGVGENLTTRITHKGLQEAVREREKKQEQKRRKKQSGNRSRTAAAGAGSSATHPETEEGGE
jgi:CRISPR-associated protein Csb1